MSSTTTLKLPDAVKRRIALLARAAGKTQHAWMVEAIQAQAELADLRRAFINDAKAAARDIDSGGPLFAMEDVAAYLRARAAGGKPPRPAAHEQQASPRAARKKAGRAA